MKYFFDTSVLVASVLVQHPQHGPSLAAYLKTHKANGCCAAHSIAEVYATMTRLPGRQRLSSEQALHLLDQTRERFTIIPFDEQDYYSAISSASAQNIVGGTIYDALLAECALKAGAEVIYTWDVGDFIRLGPEVAKRVRTP